MTESTDKNRIPCEKCGPEQAAQGRPSNQNRNSPRTTVAAVAAAAILVLPMSHLLSTREHLLSRFSIFGRTELRAATTAVLAVDALSLKIQMHNAHPFKQERFEKVALQHIARLHRTYATWAQEKQDLMGSLHLRLKVDRSGTVVSIDPLASHLTNANFIHAVMAEVRNWKFPAEVTDAAEITVPLLFVPRGMDPHTAVQWERNIFRAKEEDKAETGLRVATSSLNSLGSGHVSASVPHAAALNRAETRQAAPARLQPATENEALVAFKTNQSVILREQPRYSSKRVDELDGDTLLTLLENKGDWLKVKLADAGSIGFLRKEFVSPIN
jgi:hypothetical protein